MASSYSPCMHFFPPFLLGSWRSLTLSSLGKKWEVDSSTCTHHIQVWTQPPHLTDKLWPMHDHWKGKQPRYTSEYWDGSSSTASSKRMPLFFPMLQSLSCRGCMQCRGLKETLQFWFTPLHLCTGQTRQRLASVWALDLKRVYNTSSTFFGY